jgi:hemoglobin
MAQAKVAESAEKMEVPAAPFDLVGGKSRVRKIVDRFYDLMDAEPEYKTLRALHAADLSPMRDSLADFLMAWLGGPRDWFAQRPDACIMSAHRQIGIDKDVAGQWITAMDRAIAEGPVPPALGTRMSEALAGMARAMVR